MQESKYYPEGQDLQTVRYAKISLSASGDIVTAVANKKIRVIAYTIICATAVTVKFQSGAATDLTGAMAFPQNGGVCCPENKFGWFETAVGEKLNIVLGSGVSVAGHLTYILV